MTASSVVSMKTSCPRAQRSANKPVHSSTLKPECFFLLSGTAGKISFRVDKSVTFTPHNKMFTALNDSCRCRKPLSHLFFCFLPLLHSFSSFLCSWFRPCIVKINPFRPCSSFSLSCSCSCSCSVEVAGCRPLTLH